MENEKNLIDEEEIKIPEKISEEYFEVNSMLENTLDLSLLLESLDKDTLGENKNG